MTETLTDLQITTVYTKDQVKITDPEWLGGRYKRVFRVEIDTPEAERKGVLKLPRKFQKGSNTPITEADKLELQEEFKTLQILKPYIRNHVAEGIGRYQSRTTEGILIEEVQGRMISDRKGQITAKPTREQWERFETAINSLVDRNIYLEMDTLLLHNLMLGRVSGSDQEEVILIEPRIMPTTTDDQRIIERQYVLGAMKSNTKKLFE